MPTKKPTASSRAYSSWDVVVVPFPYTDQNSEKRRPALVISEPALDKDHGLTWLAMITSAGNRGWVADVAIADQSAAGLPSPSIIRAAKIATVDTARIIRRIGSLASDDRLNVIKSLKRYWLTY